MSEVLLNVLFKVGVAILFMLTLSGFTISIRNKVIFRCKGTLGDKAYKLTTYILDRI